MGMRREDWRYSPLVYDTETRLCEFEQVIGILLDEVDDGD